MIQNETSGGISLLSFLPKSYQLGYKVLVWNDLKAFFSSLFSMNASPIKSKGSSTADSYCQNILDPENLMNSKVYAYNNEYGRVWGFTTICVYLEFIRFFRSTITIYRARTFRPYRASIHAE